MWLCVLVAPTSTALQQRIQAGIGHTAHLVCRFTGHPDSISWYHGHTGAPVVGSRYSVTRYMREDSGVVDSRLSIERVSRRDYGPYRCKASNVYSSTDTLVFLNGIAFTLTMSQSWLHIPQVLEMALIGTIPSHSPGIIPFPPFPNPTPHSHSHISRHLYSHSILVPVHCQQCVSKKHPRHF